MKRSAIILIAVFGLFLFNACDKEEGKVAVPEQQAEEAVHEITALCPVQGLSTYQLKEEGSTEFVRHNRPLDFGEQITLLDEEMDGTTGNLNLRFQKILDKNGNEMWVNQRYMIPGGIIGVIVQDDVLLYSEAQLIKHTSTLLPKGQLIGVYPEKEGQFIQISGWNDTLYGFAQMYVKADTLSTDESDVTAIILMNRAKNEKNDIVKEQVLRSAANLNSKAFNSEIRLLLHELQGEEELTAEGSSGPVTSRTPAASSLPERETEAFIMEAVVMDDNVRVRDYPYENDTTVLGELFTDQEVVVVEKTVSVYTIGGDTAPWFKISDPEGWVFGAFIEPR